MDYLDDDIKLLVKRFEKYIKGKDSGYFDSDEMTLILKYYLANNKESHAKEVVDLAVRIHPNNDETYKILGLYYLYINDTRKALEALEQMQSFDPEAIIIHTTTLLLRNRVSDALKLALTTLEADGLIPEFYYDLTQCFLTSNHSKAALDFAKEADQHFPNEPTILLALSQSYAFQGKPRLAEKTLERIIEIDPFNDSAWMALSQAYARKDNYDKALEAINYALAVNPHSILLLAYKSDLQFFMGRFKDSTQTLLNVLQEGGDMISTYISIGRNYLEDDAPDKALEWILKADEKDPNNIHVLLYEFDAYLSLEKYQEALVVIDRMSRIKDVPLYLIYERMGVIESILGKHKEALGHFKKALRSSPDDSSLITKIGMCHWELKNYGLAKTAFLKAIDIDPTAALPYMVLAAIYYKLGQYNRMYSIIGFPEFLTDENNSIFFELCPEMQPNIKEILYAIKHKQDFSHLLVFPDTTESDDMGEQQ